MKCDPIIRQIVDCWHGGESNRSVIRHVVSRLKDGYTTFKGMAPAKRREIMRQVIFCHTENRELYRKVMTP